MLARRMLTMAFGCVVALMLCEIVARMVFPTPPYPYREPSLIYVRDPQIGYVHQPNQVGWVDDGQATINSFGLRGREPVHPKAAELYRILIVGDSITFGWGVNDNETFCDRLQEFLNRDSATRQVEVVNGGVSGYDTNQEMVLLARLAPELQPDLILVGFYWNDLVMPGIDYPHGSGNDGSTRYSSTSEHNDHLTMTDRAEPWWNRQLRHSRAAFVTGRALKRMFGAGEWNTPLSGLETELLAGHQSAEIDQRWLHFERQLGEMNEVAKEQRCRVGVIVLPSRQQVSGDYPAAEIQSKVREIAARQNCFVVDPLPTLRMHRSEAERLFIPYDRHHPTALGHQIIAEELAEVLKARVHKEANQNTWLSGDRVHYVDNVH